MPQVGLKKESLTVSFFLQYRTLKDFCQLIFSFNVSGQASYQIPDSFYQGIKGQ